MRPWKNAYLLILIAALFGMYLPALGQGYTDAEREELFWASYRLAQEKSALPTRQIALFTTILGTDGSKPVNWGGKLEAALVDGLWVTLEAIHLGDRGIDGFASVKLFPNRRAVPFYIGAGAGFSKAFGYQVLAGIELMKQFYVEVKYVGQGSALPDGIPSFGAGFTLSF